MILYLTILALQVLDSASTVYLLRRPGYVEANALMRALQEKLGLIAGTLLPKAIPMVAVYLMVAQGAMPDWVLYAILAVYVFIVGNNLRHIYQERKQ